MELEALRAGLAVTMVPGELLLSDRLTIEDESQTRGVCV